MSNQSTKALVAEPVKERSSDSFPGRNSTKLHSHHLERSAIVYVRQSTQQQVLDHQESSARQYALVDLAVELGWSPDRVEVIDEDQAHSGSTAECRLGFQRLLAEVGLDHVGVILGIELNRLSRSNKDWHQLIELCAIFRTVLVDQDGLYDPTDYNDRLLLGLRGIMSEAELHILQGRMYQAVLNKARRGELYIRPPVGYVKLPSGEFAIDPDEQAESVVRLVFDEFERLGTVRGVVRYMVRNDIKMPIRPHKGPNRGKLEWRRPTRDTVGTILTHTLYKGTYRYGYRQVDPRQKKPGKPGSGRVVAKPEDYHALIPDHCPAYITAERYERNQKRMAENRAHAESKGSPRKGPSLLAGLVRCGQCDQIMNVHYSGTEGTLRYSCRKGIIDCQAKGCQTFSGRVLDQFVSDKIIAALEPAALELSLAAAQDLQKERDRLSKNWQQRLERARYEAERIKQQYDVVEPANRLVGRELEGRWEVALRTLQDVERQYARFRQSHPPTLTDQEREMILRLSKDLPSLWNSPTTTPADRQRIIRLLVESVVVNLQGTTDRLDVRLHWAGGFTSQHELIRPVLCYAQLVDYERLIGRIKELRGEGFSFAKIADHLNREGFRPAKQAKMFHSDIVSRLLRRHDKKAPGSRAEVPSGLLKENEWLVVRLAKELEMSKTSLCAWIRRGWVRVVRQLPGYRGRIICWADADELDRLRRLRKSKHGWWDPPLSAELTTPKQLPKD